MPRLRQGRRTPNKPTEGARTAEIETRDLIAVHRQEPECRVEVFHVDHEVPEAPKAFLERLLHKAEVVAERFRVGAVNRFCIRLRVERAEGDTLGPDRLRNGRVHLDEHVVRAADMAVAHVLKQSLRFFRLAVGADARRKA
jgi:hypothetical protein